MKSGTAFLVLRVLVVLLCAAAVGAILTLPPESTIPNLVYGNF